MVSSLPYMPLFSIDFGWHLLMILFVGNGIGDLSSNTWQVSLCFTLHKCFCQRYDFICSCCEAIRNEGITLSFYKNIYFFLFFLGVKASLVKERDRWRRIQTESLKDLVTAILIYNFSSSSLDHTSVLSSVLYIFSPEEMYSTRSDL